MNVVISPSILSANFAEVGAAVKSLEKCGADWLHCDVMDGVFVPNITFGQKMVADVSGLTGLVTDVHLMIAEPEKYVKEFVECGADYVTVHIEATSEVDNTLKSIRQSGAKAGLALKPSTPVSAVEPFLDLVDMILVMSVEPGFAGQSFITSSTQKIREAKKIIGNREIRLQVDGGISEINAPSVIDAGADCIVAGSAVFKAKDMAAAIKNLRGKSNNRKICDI